MLSDVFLDNYYYNILGSLFVLLLTVCYGCIGSFFWGGGGGSFSFEL